MTTWNYLGLDCEPPSGQLLILTKYGDILKAKATEPTAIAWQELPKRSPLREQIIDLLGGLPEIRMIPDIMKHDDLWSELILALEQCEHQTQLNEFVDLVRKLHAQYLRSPK